MPWKVLSTVDTRFEFVGRLLDGERMSDLCREYGISRKTGYKFLERYQTLGKTGLENFSRAPLRVARKTPEHVENLIVATRGQYPTWGREKIRSFLKRNHPGLKLPAPSTITEILHRHGMIPERKARANYTNRSGTQLDPAVHPNDVWATDFKGQFRLGNGRYCFPLTISDLASRYFLACDALEHTKSYGVFEVYERVFSEYGLPKIIRSDNGSPFASRGIMGLSRLSLWWLKLGITPQRIRPGHPHENGSHERKHLTLKQETTRPPGKNHLQQQEKFDQFLEIFNRERPHAALEQKTPSECYRPSATPYPVQQTLDYGDCDETRLVSNSGSFRFLGSNTYYLGRAFCGEEVGLRQLTDSIWLVKFSHLNIGYIDSTTEVFVEGQPPETTLEV